MHYYQYIANIFVHTYEHTKLQGFIEMSLYSKLADLLKDTEACIINNKACKNKKFNNIEGGSQNKESSVLELDVEHYDEINNQLRVDEYHITVDMVNNAHILDNHLIINYHGNVLNIQLLWADPKHNDSSHSDRYELLSTFPLDSYKN